MNVSTFTLNTRLLFHIILYCASKDNNKDRGNPIIVKLKWTRGKQLKDRYFKCKPITIFRWWCCGSAQEKVSFILEVNLDRIEKAFHSNTK